MRVIWPSTISIINFPLECIKQQGTRLFVDQDYKIKGMRFGVLVGERLFTGEGEKSLGKPGDIRKRG